MIKLFVFFPKRPGNVVQYRIGWEYKDETKNTTDPINVTSLKEKLKEYVSKTGHLYNYKVPASKIYSKSKGSLSTIL